MQNCMQITNYLFCQILCQIKRNEIWFEVTLWLLPIHVHVMTVEKSTITYTINNRIIQVVIKEYECVRFAIYMWLILNPSWNLKSGQMWITALLEMEQDPEDNYILSYHWALRTSQKQLTTYIHQVPPMSSQTLMIIFSKSKVGKDIIPFI